MKIPTVVTEETVYFILVVFKNNEGKTLPLAITDADETENLAISLMPYADAVTVRREIVYRRDENNEVSISEPWKKYTHHLSAIDLEFAGSIPTIIC